MHQFIELAVSHVDVLILRVGVYFQFILRTWTLAFVLFDWQCYLLLGALLKGLDEKLGIFVFGLDRMRVGVIVSFEMVLPISVGLFFVVGGVSLGM